MNIETGTRQRVLRTVSEQGPITAVELADRLEVTPTAVRRHLDALVAEGQLSERDSQRDLHGERRRGRPARAYVVTDAGHSRLRSDYDDLAADLLAFLAEQGGDEAVQAYARRRASVLAEGLELPAEGTVADRTQALATALDARGFATSTRPLGTGVQLCQGHCPVQHVAEQFPALCEAETEMFSRVLGVHVQRLASLAHGDHVCTTFVPTPAQSGNGQHPQSTTRRDES
ncbi:helix-turn-helix transcriptional regulator [Branchiibius cervicis]|uniref:Helix-turn-helix transcriptional regulator n=1 Tax=Branchiibius cervicis TaxID=908252 RepID=A0ABW2ASN7_9MICO